MVRLSQRNIAKFKPLGIKNKVKFFKYCVGLVRIALDDADQQRLNSPALHVAWRVPYYVTLDRCDALQWAVQRWICRT